MSRQTRESVLETIRTTRDETANATRITTVMRVFFMLGYAVPIGHAFGRFIFDGENRDLRVDLYDYCLGHLDLDGDAFGHSLDSFEGELEHTIQAGQWAAMSDKEANEAKNAQRAIREGVNINE